MKVFIFNGIIMLVVIVFTKRTPTKAPIGIKRCERQCQYLKGCCVVQFDTNSLECFTLSDPKDELKGSPSLTTRKLLDIKNSLPELTKSCSEGEQQIVNRYHQPVCVPSNASFVGVSALVSSWLLVVPYNDKSTTAFKMNLVTGEVKRCPFFWKQVWAIALIKAESRYLISTNKRIISSPMTSRNDNILRFHITVQHMCLDEKRGIVFIDVRLRKSHVIQQMTMFGEILEEVFEFKGVSRINSVDIYPPQEKIYVTLLYSVVSISYEGYQIEDVLTIDTCEILFAKYDIAQGTLYYFDKKTHAIMSATRKGNPRVVKTNMTISSPFFALHDDVLYLSEGNTNQIMSLNLQNKKYHMVQLSLSNATERLSWNFFIL